MDFKFVNTKINLNEGVDPNKFLANRAVAKNPERVKSLFVDHGYDLTQVPGEFLKTLTFDDREEFELSEVLNEIDKIGLKDIFNANLRPASFTRSFLARVQYCLENHIPFLNSDNTFIADLKNDSMPEAQEVKAESTPVSPILDTSLDTEDIQVKSDIIKTLGELNATTTEPMLTFIITSIINNLDTTIKNSAKQYRTLGLRSIVENALNGVVLTPEMQELVNKEILNAFPIVEERGL